jgi:hypothetical protein
LNFAAASAANSFACRTTAPARTLATSTEGGGAGNFGSPPIPPPPIPPPPPVSPFGEAAKDSLFGSGQMASLNPYSSPAAVTTQPMASAIPSLPINPQPVAADAVFNYAWEIWKINLGLLLGVTVTIIAANYAIALPFQGVQMVLQQNGEQEAAIGVAVLAQLLVNVVQLYLGIGQVQINLKLARRQLATFGDLFGGFNVFLPLLGAWIIAWFALIFGFLLLIVPGILMILAFWPFFYLIIDRKTGVIESFSIASRITQGNWGSSFVLWIMSVGIMILGCLAMCIGMLFAMPLVSMMFAVAYLMMSGQLSPYPMYAAYQAPYPAPAAK